MTYSLIVAEGYTQSRVHFKTVLRDQLQSIINDYVWPSSGGGYSPPEGGIPMEDLSTDVQTLLNAAGTALQSFTETDPTVYSWAKQPNKPTYNIAEIVYSSGRVLSSKLEEMDAAIATAVSHDGVTPHIDTTTGHWFIGNTDTGVVARGQDGVASGDDVVVVHDLEGEPTLESGQVAVLGADMGATIAAMIRSYINSDIVNNIESLNRRLNALIGSLAGIAFRSSIPVTEDTEWSGEKYTVSVDTTGLSGASVQEVFPRQVLEGSSAVLTIVPTNSEHLLRSASYKLSANGESITVPIANNKAVITLNDVQADATVYVMATATAKSLFTASVGNSKVTADGTMSGIVEGSAWECTLGLNSTAEQYDAITSVTPTMEGGGTITYDSATNKVSTGYVTGNISIAVVVVAPSRVGISLPEQSDGVVVIDNDTSTEINELTDSAEVLEGSSVDLTIKPTFDFALNSVSASIDGTPVTVTNNGDGSYGISVNSLDDDLVITASTTFINMAYKNVRYSSIKIGSETSNSANCIGLVFGDTESYTTSPLVDLGDNFAGGDLYFGCGAAVNEGHFVFFDKNMKYLGYYRSTSAITKTYNALPSNARFVCFTIGSSNFANAFIATDSAAQDKLFDGSLYSESASDDRYKIGAYTDFLLTPYAPKTTNSRGGHPYVGVTKANVAYNSLTTKSTGDTTKPSWYTLIPKTGYTRSSFIDVAISEEISLSGVTSVSFSGGSGTYKTGHCMRVRNGSSSFNYYGNPGSNKNVSSYTHGYLVLSMSAYATSYINDQNGDSLWVGTSNFSSEDIE